MIRKAKRKHFSDSVTQSKDTRAIWQLFRKINNNDKSSDSSFPDEIVINNERYTSSEKVATKLNEYSHQFQIFLALTIATALILI